MAQYVHLNNRDNRVIKTIEWDGQTAAPVPDPEEARDTSIIPLPEGQDPWVGDVWNGSVFLRTSESVDPAPPPLRSRKRAVEDD